MTLRTPFDFVLEPPGADGQKMVSVADPLGSAVGPATYYLARRFEFVEGDYTFEFAADDAATVWLGTSQLNSIMIGSTTLGVPGVSYQHVPQGSYRLDVILQNLPAGQTPCYFVLVVKLGDTVVYASDKTDWLLDDQSISDDDLPPAADYRFKLPVFSVLPNWKNGVLERLAWQTDVMESETDAEQRRSVRRNARRTFDASFLRQRQQRDRLDTFFVGLGPAEFMMPLWHEAVKLIDGLDMEGAGVFFDDGQFVLREFRKGDLVFVNSGDPDDYDILQVGDTEQNRFSWAFPPPRAWPPGTRIYPMRIARMGDQAPTMQNVTDTVSTASVRFECVEPYTVPESWGGSLGGEPLFRFIPDRAQTIDVTYNRRNYTLDNNSGVPVTLDHGKYTATQVQMRLALFGRAEAYAFRQFLQAARGMAKRFFMPTHMQDVEPLGDIPADTIDLLIRNQGFWQYMLRPQPIRVQLAFILRSGAQTLYRTIKNVTPVYRMDPDGSVSTPNVVVSELLTLDTPLPQLELSDIRRVSFVAETRFAQDTFELLHASNSQAHVSTSLVFRQAKNTRTMP